ncbi:MAG TPA: CPBP family intramembrane glutamic endopeptidase [Pyrinomonadaceae bacterium]|nr:CPBP family intramembrane glutamic endopeptidase [Pyrinomonadaceae bacterium]
MDSVSGAGFAGRRAGAGVSGRSLFVFVLLFFAVWALRATVLFPLDERVEPPWLRAVYGHAWKFAVWVVPAYVYVRARSRRRPLEYMKLTTRPRAKGLLAAAVAAVLFFAGVILFEGFTSGRNLNPLWRAGLPAALSTLLAVAVSPVMEEILFRGFLLNALRERAGFWTANLLTALLFVLVHWPHWLWAGGWRPSLVAVSASILILALFLGLVLRWTNSLWPCVLVHVFNNFLSSFLRA